MAWFTFQILDHNHVPYSNLIVVFWERRPLSGNCKRFCGEISSLLCSGWARWTFGDWLQFAAPLSHVMLRWGDGARMQRNINRERGSIINKGVRDAKCAGWKAPHIRIRRTTSADVVKKAMPKRSRAENEPTGGVGRAAWDA